MKILMVNKFLHPNGGSETYIFNLGRCLQEMGHEVQYFGMEHAGRIVGNRVGAYTADMDFHGGVRRIFYPVKTIYSGEARRKIRLVLEDFQPDVVHLNNFNYQLTPSILLEIRKWDPSCRIVYTAHDYQLICPNHMCHNPVTNENCQKCLGGHYINCGKGKCIHGSFPKSVIGTLEAAFWKRMGVYRQIDKVICCSQFMKDMLDGDPVLSGKTVVLRNFVDGVRQKETQKKDYVLYFGRYSREKGIGTLVEAAKRLPQIPFVFAGSGPMKESLQPIANIRDVGFCTGESLENLICQARFSVYPSEWYENCPFAVMESQMYGTPVLGANIGGIPELIRDGQTGELFESGNAEQLTEKIAALWSDRNKTESYAQNCGENRFLSVREYAEELMNYYR